MSKERLLVAKATEVQLTLAATLLRQALANLRALQYGVEPAVEASKKALHECEKAVACTEIAIERIPE